MVISVFDLEKRTNLKKECLKIEKYLDTEMYSTLRSSYNYYNFWAMVNSFIEYWPYRYTATNIQDFFDLYQLPFEVKKMNNEQCLYYLQIILDLIMWIVKQRYLEYTSIQYMFVELRKNNSSNFKTIIENIDLIIELLNYEVVEINEHFTFIKRDADVDSILPILENEDDLRIALLEYNDFRIENNREEKKIILKKIGDYLEPNRRELSSLNKSLTDDVFFILNKFYIRHNNDGNIKFDTDEEYILWYDNLFKMMIQLIRTKNIKEIQNQLKDFKK